MALKFNEQVKRAIDRGAEIAKEMKSEFYVVEHIFLALLEDAEFVGVLKDFSVNIEDYKKGLEDYIKSNIESSTEEPFESESIANVIARSAIRALSSGRDEVGMVHLLTATNDLPECQALYLLETMGINFNDIIFEYSHPEESGEDEDEEGMPMMGGFFPFGGMPKPKKDSWKKYVTNVTEEVKTHPEPFVGREEEKIGRAHV